MGDAVMTEQDADPDYSEAELERGRLLFARECTFMWGAATLDQLPEAELPEIAFARPGSANTIHGGGEGLEQRLTEPLGALLNPGVRA